MQIKLSSRFSGLSFHGCFISVDGTDMKIKEPSPFSSCWYSHKFKSSGLRYEIGVCLFSSQIAWINGPFPCGARNNQRMFKSNLRDRLWSSEKVVADGGYSGEKVLSFDELTSTDQRKFILLRAKHEALNGRLKCFGVLSQVVLH